MKKGKNYWTKERCKEEALKYESKKDFKKNCIGAFSSAYRNHKCLDEICSHMKVIGNKYKRCIYAYEFSDNFVYVGLTSNIKRRNHKHLKRGTVYNHIQINSIFSLKQLTDYVLVEEAKKLEEYFITYYDYNNWNVLNKNKAGGIGGQCRKWTKENCQSESLKYKTRKEFSINNGGAYRYCLLNGWLDDVCKHMKKRNKWTKDNCKKEALKYSSRFEFCKKSKSAYTSALNNDWLDEICVHMTLLMKKNYWNYDTCKTEANKYKNRTEFSTNSDYVYRICIKNKWIDDFLPKYMKNGN